MQPKQRRRYPDLQGFEVLADLSKKLANLSLAEKDRLNGMLSTLRVRWSVELYETFPRHDRLRGAFMGLHELHVAIRYLADEMTTDAPEIKVQK